MSFDGSSIVIVSRCARTLFNFRSSLLRAIAGYGAHAVAIGDGRDGFGRRLLAAGIAFEHVAVAMRGISPVNDVLLLCGLILKFRRIKPTVVHTFTIKPAIYGTIAAKLSGVPVRVVTITGLGHAFTSANAWLQRLVRILYRVSLSFAHFVYFQNSDDRDLFVRGGLVAASKSDVVCGSGVDVERFRPLSPAVQPDQRGLRFLMIARLIREKGVTEFISAATKVKQQRPATQFVLLGDEDSRNPTALSAAEVGSLKKSEVVRWLGGVDDVRPFIDEADIVVLPSYREGMPRTLLEAAAMGRPAITTDCVGCRDAVKHEVTGYIVPVKDSDALASAMLRFIDEPGTVASMGAAARQHAICHFDEKAVIDATLSTYRRLLPAKPGG